MAPFPPAHYVGVRKQHQLTNRPIDRSSVVVWLVAGFRPCCTGNTHHIPPPPPVWYLAEAATFAPTPAPTRALTLAPAWGTPTPEYSLLFTLAPTSNLNGGLPALVSLLLFVWDVLSCFVWELSVCFVGGPGIYVETVEVIGV